MHFVRVWFVNLYLIILIILICIVIASSSYIYKCFVVFVLTTCAAWCRLCLAFRLHCLIVYRSSWGFVCQSQPPRVFPFLQCSVCQNVTYTLGYVVGFRLGRYLEGKMSSCRLHCKRNRLRACQKHIAVTGTPAWTKAVLTIETHTV
jgi:hypothetical protein